MSTKIITVDASVMDNSALVSEARAKSPSQVTKYVSSVNAVCDERIAFEATQERRALDGSTFVGQSNDIKFVEKLRDNRAFALHCYVSKSDPRAIIFPQSKEGGKSSSETSNLKGYNKIRQMIELVYTGASDCENVAKVLAVVMWKLSNADRDRVFKREEIETVLSSYDIRRMITQGSADFLKAVDDVASMQATQMSGGKQTQSSQMVRALVALGCAEDVRNGRNKDTRFLPDAPLYRALMLRFGQIVPEQAIAA